jgi:hypothetical protein
MTRRVISWISVVALVFALCTSLLWWYRGSWNRMEAAASTFTLFAAVVGIPAERWAASRERRNRALHALRQELAKNREVTADDRFTTPLGATAARKVYPRLLVSAVDTALISGAFDARQDQELLSQLYEWRDAVRELNRRLDLTEIHLFTVPSIGSYELRSFEEALRGEGGYFRYVCDKLDELGQRLDEPGGQLVPQLR